MAQPAVKSKGLGKGLSALMGDTAPASGDKGLAGRAPTELPLASMAPGKYQPRRHFDENQLAELALSIGKHGLMQPIVVRQVKPNQYEIIAGERRYRAAQLANLKTVPALIRTATDAEALELALIENIQRADLNPLEEAEGYQRLMDEFGYTQEKLAPVVGKSRSHISNLLRLMKLPESIKNRIDSSELTMGHARALLMAKNPEALAKQIIEIGLSVRQAEDLASGKAALSAAPSAKAEPGVRTPKLPSRGSAAPAKTDDVLQLEAMLSQSLGLDVSIQSRGGQAGEVVIRYDSLKQLDEILRRLGD